MYIPPLQGELLQRRQVLELGNDILCTLALD